MASYRDTLYTSGVSGVVHAWDANKMEERHHLGGAGRDGRLLPESHQDMVMDLLTIPTLESLASASMDHTIRLWDSTSSRLRRVLSGHDKVCSRIWVLIFAMLISEIFTVSCAPFFSDLANILSSFSNLIYRASWHCRTQQSIASWSQ